MSDAPDSPGNGFSGKGKSRRGGKRSPPGGRPRGARNALPLGAVGALKSLRWRVPEGAPEAIADLADEALARTAELMRGKLPRNGAVILGACKMIREEACGPAKQRVELSTADLSDEQLEAKLAALRAKERGE